MERPDFVHLHLHSEYSLSDGIIRIKELVSRASSLQYSAVGLTDLTNLFDDSYNGAEADEQQWCL